MPPHVKGAGARECLQPHGVKMLHTLASLHAWARGKWAKYLESPFSEVIEKRSGLSLSSTCRILQ